jgi:thiol-disulfide isomerase/thioredoxin
MNKVFISLLICSIFNSCLAQKTTSNWYEIHTNGKIVPIGKIAKPGKISVFIISASWCGPCKGLRKHLEATRFDENLVDFYYVENQEGNLEAHKRYEKSIPYKIWTKIEGLETYPLIYIASQTTNIVSKFGGDEEKKYEKIVEIVNALLIDGANLSSDMIWSAEPIQANTKQHADNNIETPSQLFRIKLGTFKGKPNISHYGNVFNKQNIADYISVKHNQDNSMTYYLGNFTKSEAVKLVKQAAKKATKKESFEIVPFNAEEGN